MNRLPLDVPRPSLLAAVCLAASTLAGVPAEAQAPAPTTVSAADARLRFFGQLDAHDPQQPHLAYPGTGLLLRFTGKAVSLNVDATKDTTALTVVVNGAAPLTYPLNKGEQSIVIAADSPTAPQTVAVFKRTETWQGILTVNGVTLPAGATLLTPPALPRRRLLFIGDSVTCGTGLDDNATCVDDRLHPSSNAYDTYGLRLGRRLDAESRLVCYGGRGLERDYLGREAKDNVLTVPQLIDLAIPADAPNERVHWDTQQWQPDAIVVSVGTNDFNLQATKPLDPARWTREYLAFASDLRKQYPGALILLTEGAIVTNALLRQLVQEVATRAGDPRIRYVPSTHYPGHSCDGHPTNEQHLQITNDFAPVLQDALGW